MIDSCRQAPVADFLNETAAVQISLSPVWPDGQYLAVCLNEN